MLQLLADPAHGLCARLSAQRGVLQPCSLDKSQTGTAEAPQQEAQPHHVAQPSGAGSVWGASRKAVFCGILLAAAACAQCRVRRSAELRARKQLTCAVGQRSCMVHVPGYQQYACTKGFRVMWCSPG
jgi:hypothetical protein